MSRRKKGRAISGVILLDKPAGLSSNRALQNVRRLFDARKAGHTGSLDPFATGMLPICLGEASKTAAFMIDSDKTYRAEARLGISTETGDTEGEIIEDQAVPALSRDQVLQVFDHFTGEIEQVPPMYSALKHEGQPLYKLARQGKVIERKPRRCTIHRLELELLEDHRLIFEVKCSKGTYIRTLAEDLASAMGTCAHLTGLRRLSVEPFSEEDMVEFEKLEAAQAAGTLVSHLLPIDVGLPHWPVIRLEAGQVAGFRNGNPQQTAAGGTGWVRVRGPHGLPLGLAERDDQGLVSPRRVFNPDDPPAPERPAFEH